MSPTPAEIIADEALKIIEPKVRQYEKLAEEMLNRMGAHLHGDESSAKRIVMLDGKTRCTFCGQPMQRPRPWSDEVVAEWRNQADLRDQGKFPFASFDGEAPFEHMLTVLVEEVGETAEATLALRTQDQPSELAQELLQVAAIALGWRERVLRRGSPI